MSISNAISALNTQRKALATNLTAKGQLSNNNETLSELIPKVLDITTGDGYDTSDATATAEDILKDKVAYISTGRVVGTRIDSSGLNPILKLDGFNNTGLGHNASVTTWKDLSNTVSNATIVTGNAIWGDKYLRLDGNSYWNVNAPNLSRGTVEIVVSIDTDFIPVNTNYWYQASCIFGCEIGGTQQDLGILVSKDGYFAIGYDNSTIWTSSVFAKDGLPHTIVYTYYRGAVLMAIDGIVANTFTKAISGTECTYYGIGWNCSSLSSKIKGNIYSVKWFKEFLTPEQITTNHSANKAYYVF